MGIFKKKPKPVGLKSKSSFSGRKGTGILLIILAVVLAFGVLPFFNASRSETATIAVAKTDIKKGQTIEEENVQFTERGVYGLSGFFEDKKDVIGKVAANEMLTGDVITKNKVGKENVSRLQALINEGKTLTSITIKSNAAGVASHLNAGDFVGVYSAAEDDYGILSVTQNPLLSNVEIYDIENADTNSIDRENAGDSSEIIVSTITFITTSKAQEAALLNAEYNGSIHIVFVER